MNIDNISFEVVADDGSKLVVSGIGFDDLQAALAEMTDAGEKLADFGMLCGGGCTGSGAVCGAGCELK